MKRDQKALPLEQLVPFVKAGGTILVTTDDLGKDLMIYTKGRPESDRVVSYRFDDHLITEIIKDRIALHKVAVFIAKLCGADPKKMKCVNVGDDHIGYKITGPSK